MAKKGGVQQLQTEINTNEELMKFLEKDGLLILDVYTEWCGPCLAMIGSLKKIKLEQGGDDLQLATVKCDNIEVFERFRNKSEPTWLFASKGKLVNCLFGANVPELMELITKELDIERKSRDPSLQTERTFFELTDMTPIEQARHNLKLKEEEETERIEQEAAQRRRHDYIRFVTDKIMKHASDLGVTLLMPHVVSRDLFKRLTDPGERIFQLIARDKRAVQILPEHMEMIHFECENPIPRYVLDYIAKKDAFAICWKVAESELRTVEEVLNDFASLVSSEQPGRDENGLVSASARPLPPMLRSHSIMTDKENVDEDDDVTNQENGKTIEQTDEICEGSKNDDESKNNGEDSVSTEKTNGETEANEVTFAENADSENTNTDTLTENHEKLEEENVVLDSNNEGQQENDMNVKPDENENEKITEQDDKEKKVPVSVPDSRVSIETLFYLKSANKVKVRISPIWTPKNRRANASLIYLYFRNLTEHFLPPDPPPEKPHVLMTFDAYKRKDIMDIIERNRPEILAYGYFTSDDFDSAVLIANSTYAYQKNPPTIHDKLIVKVAKMKSSNTIATLVEHGPNHVSKNAEIGKEESLKFFPIGYINGSETGEPDPVPEDVGLKKRKKRRKSRIQVDEGDGEGKTENKSTDEQPEKESVTGETEDLDDEDEDETIDEINEDENDDEGENGGDGPKHKNGVNEELKNDNS